MSDSQLRFLTRGIVLALIMLVPASADLFGVAASAAMLNVVRVAIAGLACIAMYWAASANEEGADVVVETAVPRIDVT